MDIEQVVTAASGVEPEVDEQRVQWELEGYVTGHYVIVGGNAVRDDLLPSDEIRPRWSITSIGAADWCMRELARVEAIVREYDEEVVRWSKLRVAAFKAGEFFRGHLERWAVAERTDKRKSFPLAHGTVTTRESKPAPEVVDEDAAVAWCKIHAPAAVNVKETVAISRVAGLRITPVVEAWRFTDGLGEVRTVGMAELTGIFDHTDYRPFVDLVRAVLAEHASPLRLAADGVEAEWIRTELTNRADFAIVSVEAVVGPGVVDSDGLPAAGFGVRPGKITPTVSVA